MKKIINTIMGVLVRLYWKVNDLLKEFMNNLDFIIHWKRNKQEAIDFEKEELSFNKRREQFINELQEEKNKYELLSQKYLERKRKLLEVEKKLGESTLAIQEENHKYIDMKCQYEDALEEKDIKISELDSYLKLVKRLERKVNYRNNLIENLRNEKEGLRNTICNLNEELEALNRKIKFIESKLPKKTLEEIIAYTFSQKEVLKRNKKNDNR